MAPYPEKYSAAGSNREQQGATAKRHLNKYEEKRRVGQQGPGDIESPAEECQTNHQRVGREGAPLPHSRI